VALADHQCEWHWQTINVSEWTLWTRIGMDTRPVLR